ncbi:hypothetical protein HPB52_019353 [Rhipicephalus sanguineus]|uniref:Rhodanese domain-containing protein n=1 Tax=Rhipicephalus sanguineus TaxID=34632 RepID=A0A9D4T066_RHISA|nr:hypothetical protein HPB52_019353 [Rhipicephalus sanguineus]
MAILEEPATVANIPGHLVAHGLRPCEIRHAGITRGFSSASSQGRCTGRAKQGRLRFRALPRLIRCIAKIAHSARRGTQASRIWSQQPLQQRSSALREADEVLAERATQCATRAVMFFKPVLSVVRSNRVPWLLGRRLAAAPLAGFHTKQIVVLEACATTACRSTQLGPCIVGSRPVSTSGVNFQDLSYEDLEALLQGGDIQLIDVREPSEVAASGKIGNAINIPLGQVKDALLMSEEAFLKTYNAQKPQSYDHNIVFYGLGPIKSHAALKLAHKAGYAQYVSCFQES